MTQIIHVDTSSDYTLHHQAKNLLGKPIRITFEKKTLDNNCIVKSLFFIPDTTPVKFTEITARTDTSKGSIISQFLMASEINEKTCTLFTNYNHDDTAILDFQLIHFYKLVDAQKKTRKDDNCLSDSLNHFHHWLASEIYETLNGTGYFSKLHDGAEIRFLTLKRLPKVWAKPERA